MQSVLNNQNLNVKSISSGVLINKNKEIAIKSAKESHKLLKGSQTLSRPDIFYGVRNKLALNHY